MILVPQNEALEVSRYSREVWFIGVRLGCSNTGEGFVIRAITPPQLVVIYIEQTDLANLD